MSSADPAKTQLGITSLAAAVAFAILYLPFFFYYLSRAIARPIYVYIIITLFCASTPYRYAAFVIRALLTRVQSDERNVHVLIAYEILYNTGFFGLLYSTYALITGRVAAAKNPPSGPISRLLRHHFLFRIALVAAVAIGITGAIDSTLGTTASTLHTGNTLRKVATYIFLVCAILVFLQTFFLARVELSEDAYRGSGKIGATHGVFILLVISLLLVVREAFFTATAGKSKQNNEVFWYPFAVVTEYIAVVLLGTPGLVPDGS